MKTLQIVTLGCSKNRVDSEHILAQLETAYDIVPEDSAVAVDIQIINTCGFIGDAKEESIQAILESVERKKSGEIGSIYVCGCLSQRYMADMPGLIPEVDGWFGARENDSLVRHLGVEPDKSREQSRVLTTPSHYAYLKISEG